MVTDLAFEFKASVIKKALNLLREELYQLSNSSHGSLFTLVPHSISFDFLLLNIIYHADDHIWGLYGQVLRRLSTSTQPTFTPTRWCTRPILQRIE